MTVNLEELDALYAATTPGEWRACKPCSESGSGCSLLWSPSGEATILHQDDDMPAALEKNRNAALIATLQNAYPAMAEEIRSLRARCARLEAHAAEAEAFLEGT